MLGGGIRTNKRRIERNIGGISIARLLYCERYVSMPRDLFQRSKRRISGRTRIDIFLHYYIIILPNIKSLMIIFRMISLIAKSIAFKSRSFLFLPGLWTAVISFISNKIQQILVDHLLKEYNETMFGIRTQIRYYHEPSDGILKL